MASIGSAMTDILSSQNPKNAIMTDRVTDQIFAHRITQIALYSCMTHAPTKTRVSNVTIVLLFTNDVVRNHDVSDARLLLVYFSRNHLILSPQRYLSACSKSCIQKSNIPIQARSCRGLKLIST